MSGDENKLKKYRFPETLTNQSRWFGLPLDELIPAAICIGWGNVAALRQGTSGAKIQTSTETGNQHKYQTRVVSNANKVNLKFEEAKPVLEDQLAKSIANIL